MKFTPREIKNNVNISPAPPVRDFCELAIKILGCILVIYILLGFAVDYVAPRVSTTTELRLGSFIAARLEKEEQAEGGAQLQRILDELVKHSRGLPPFPYKVYVKKSADVNAMALPGGNIVVLSALLKEVESENELAIVLAHELGHYYYRDHLKGLGRGLVFLVISSALFGSDSSISKVIINAVTNAETRFSQGQEKAADVYALELLNAAYGSAAGAADFLEKMSRKERLWPVFYIFASHPYPQSRIAAIKEQIRLKGYPAGQKMPFHLEITQEE